MNFEHFRKTNNMRNLIILFLLLALSQPLAAQLVWTEPFFPRPNEPVTLYFDASKGTAGLKDCNCTVYIHTGVITNQSASTSDWKNVTTTWGVANSSWALQPVPGRPNVYRFDIKPSIRSYYGTPANVEIRSLAMVFRNANGTREGKDTGGKDIFAPVYNQTGLLSALLAPSSRNLVVDPNERIPVQVAASATANFSLWEDGQRRFDTTGTLLQYTLRAAVTGTHQVRIVARSGADSSAVDFTYTVRSVSPVADPPAGTQLGLSILPNNRWRFALEAPGKNGLFLVGNFNNWTPSTEYQLNRSTDGQVHWLEIPAPAGTGDIFYQYQLDDGKRVGDPYSTLVLDPNNDRFIPNVTFPNLPPYPSGLTTGIVSWHRRNAPEYAWQVNDFVKPPQERLVIYELLLRDFIARHDYATLVDTLDYLQRLGVNAIQLMPIQEFEGNESWGYNPSYHQALDKYYGTPESLKRFVDACHQRGIAVILDVVFNHAFSQSPLAQMYWDEAAQRPATNNPWLNVSPTHDFNVGYDFNHESAATKRFVTTVLDYWQREFRVDGFRFDLSKGFTQKFTLGDVGAWGRYDLSRINILKNYADAIWQRNPRAYVILEHFADNAEEVELARQGMLLWSNLNGQFSEGLLGFSHDWGGLDYQARSFVAPRNITYLESHDEERVMYKNLQFGGREGSYNVRDLPTALQRTAMANVIFYTVPGPKMLWQFGEVGYDFSINTCTDLSVSNNCRLANKPIRWDYPQVAARRNLYQVIRSMLFLRRNYAPFATSDYRLILGNGARKEVVLRHPDFNVVAVGNTGLTTQTFAVNFPSTGVWHNYFQRDSFAVSSSTRSFTLSPGEYRLFTSKRLPSPPAGVITDVQEVLQEKYQLMAWPNPANGPLNIGLTLPEREQVDLSIWNALGQMVHQVQLGWLDAGIQQFVWEGANDLAPGWYLLKLSTSSGVVGQTFIRP